jgi:GT2 family glycosyltransferase
MPQVSVIIPTYNRANLIGETLDSVLAQTYHNFEIIVVDDGSTDNTPAVISTGYKNLVRYIRQENAGQAAARNAGIRAANGIYVAFLDDDDLWLPHKLAQQMALFEGNSAVRWVYCDAQVFDGTSGQALHNFSQINPPHTGQTAHYLLERNFIASPTPIIRRDIFEKVGYFDESGLLRQREDWDMWLRLAADYSVSYVSEVLARYRVHLGSVTQTESADVMYQSRAAVIERAVAFAPQVYGPVRAQAMAALSLFAGRQLILAGQSTSARQMFAQAIRWQPALASAYSHWLLSWLGPVVSKKVAYTLRWLRSYWHRIYITNVIESESK